MQVILTKTYTKSKGIKKKLEGQAATEDTINSWKIGGTDGVSGATRTADAVKAAALEAIHQAEAKEDVPETIDTAALEAAIADAKALTEADYTAESWSALQEALTAAEGCLRGKGIPRCSDCSSNCPAGCHQEAGKSAGSDG